ncbi:MAG: GAF domain-containing protein, partial [Steroidobacteraceae bacterium]
MRAVDENVASVEGEPPGFRPPFPPAFLPDTTRPEAALAKANRELRMLIDCKRALARAQEEPQLLGEICRILVGPGGYRLAWLGFADSGPACAVRVVAHAGQDTGYLEELRVSWSDNDSGRGPTGRAIREHAVQMCREIDDDRTFLPWREQAHRRGYRSSVALPLLLDGSCIGALNIYADRPDAFDQWELALLEELAADLAFGVKAIRAQVEMRRQRRQIDGLAQVVRVHSAINSAMARIRDRDELLREACRLLVQLGGFFGAVVWMLDDSGRWAWLKHRAGEDVRDRETLQRLEMGDGTGPDPSLAGLALRTGKVTVCTDIARNDMPVAARERLLARGIRSLIAMPMIVDGKPVAAITLTGRDAAAVEDAELLPLLENMTASLSFGLHSLERADAAQYLASFDPLTGLAKRALFCERLDRRLHSLVPGEASALPAVIAFDVRGLGSLNTIHGQRLADLLLRSLA